MDALEATANAVLGLTLSLLAVWAAWPLFGWSVTWESNLAVSAVFFVISWVRNWLIRKLFRRISDAT